MQYNIYKLHFRSYWTKWSLGYLVFAVVEWEMLSNVSPWPCIHGVSNSQRGRLSTMQTFRDGCLDCVPALELLDMSHWKWLINDLLSCAGPTIRFPVYSQALIWFTEVYTLGALIAIRGYLSRKSRAQIVPTGVVNGHVIDHSSAVFPTLLISIDPYSNNGD